MLPLVWSLLPVAAADPAPPALSDTPVSDAGALTDPNAVVDQWLEEVDGERALDTVRRWNAATAAVLEADPLFRTFEAEALEILTSDARLAEGGIRGGQFDNFWQDPEHVRGLWRTTSLKAYLKGAPEWEVLLDVDALDAAEQQNWIWHGATCAPGSPRCMIGLSRGGTDAAEYREFDRDTRQFVPGGFFVPEAKSDVAWLDEDTLLVGTDRGPGSLTESGYPRTVVKWARGTDLRDAEELYAGEVTDVWASPIVLHHGDDAVAYISRGRTFYDQEVHLVGGAGVERLPLPERHAVIGLFHGVLILQVLQDWTFGADTYRSGSLVAFALEDRSARLVLEPPEGGAIEQVALGKNTIFVQLLDDVVGKLIRMKPKGLGWQVTAVDLPDNGVVSLSATDDGRDDALVTFESLTVPKTLFYVDKKGGTRELQSLPAFFDATDVVVEQRFATSKDGTRVPYFVMGRRDVLERGNAPTIQYGYGGFLASILPTYFEEAARPQQGAFAGKLWVARGGVLVLSNIRGGAEYGPTWHEAGLKLNRQRVFDDFFAIGEHLVSTGVTSPEKLGAIGRSNGGLLMGVAWTQRPDLYAAIDCGVPLLDMLRYDQLLAGASWVGEYGDPDVPEERAVLEQYSPYQNVTESMEYPSILFYTSTKDDRVHPGHARRMAAKLEHLGIPFYYFENIDGGHGGVANQEQAAYRLAVEFSFLARETGLGQ